MQDFDTTQESTDAACEDRELKRQRLREFVRSLPKRFVLFVSFGPGVIGFLWLLGRILRR